MFYLVNILVNGESITYEGLIDYIANKYKKHQEDGDIINLYKVEEDDGNEINAKYFENKVIEIVNSSVLDASVLKRGIPSIDRESQIENGEV